MKDLDALRLDNGYARLHPAFYEVVDPTPLSNPKLVAFSDAAAGLIDLDPAAAHDPRLLAVLAGARRLPGSEPVAAIYAGHQFGVWVPQLGDGRAILLGEVVNDRGERWDLQLKGAGQTRFSRMGDGRSVLRSAIREHLVSEAMAALGIPTTRSLAVVGSDEVVYRETPETAATLLRLAPSHVRFGTFQLFASRGQTDRVRELAEHVIGQHHPELAGEEDRIPRWLDTVVERTARLVADWMAVGWAHGVLNTDNMSVLGVTLDYGPYGFQDDFDPHFICNHTDHAGRYAYDQQPAVGLWNLARFAEALLSLITEDEANQALGGYPAAFDRRYGELMRGKLGLARAEDDDREFLGALLTFLAKHRVDYPRFWRRLADVWLGPGVPDSLRPLVADQDALAAWLASYRARAERDPRPPEERRAAILAANPKYVLRNYLAQQAIEKATEGDFTEVERLGRVLSRPFDEQPEHERYADQPPPWAREIVVSCSS
ncbi:MAG: YdiU family protein [Gemmatimonadales bacterium]